MLCQTTDHLARDRTEMRNEGQCIYVIIVMNLIRFDCCATIVFVMVVVQEDPLAQTKPYVHSNSTEDKECRVEDDQDYWCKGWHSLRQNHMKGTL